MPLQVAGQAAVAEQYRKGQNKRTSEISHKELTQVDVYNTRIFWQATADRVHRNDILRVIVTYGSQVTELSCYGLFRAEQVNGLHIKPALVTHSHEVHLPVTQDTSRNLESLRDQMVVDDGSAMQFQAPVVITSEESGSVLSAIRDIVDDIRTSVQNRKEGSTITIQSLSIPQTDDIEEAVRFIRDLREQIEREQTA